MLDIRFDYPKRLFTKEPFQHKVLNSMSSRKQLAFYRWLPYETNFLGLEGDEAKGSGLSFFYLKILGW